MALLLWYHGLGETLVFATCPLVAGIFLFSLLHFLQRWSRPARLWERIRIVCPKKWIIMALISSFLSFVYVWSLNILQNRLPILQALQPMSVWETEWVILLTWFAMAGVAITVGNVISLLYIPVEALLSEGIWLTLSCKWTEGTEKGWRKTFSGKIWVYYDGTYDISTQRKFTQPFFMMERSREGRWKIIVPQMLSNLKGMSSVTMRRPSARRIEYIYPGKWRFVQEGDILTFSEQEKWYILIEKIYP